VTGVGTPAFQAPETAAAQPHCSGYKIDIWASGVTLYNMISGRYPFDGSNNYTLFESIMRCEYSMPLEADSQLADLLYGILEKDSAKRLTIEMISAHP
jgi:serine/threonine-protein kinase 11